MGLYNRVRLPHNMDCNKADGAYAPEIQIVETQLPLHLDDLARNIGLPHLFDYMLALSQ